MNPGGFSFEIVIRSGGTLVGRTPASLAACHEDDLFRRIVAGRHPNDGTLPALTVSPVWDGDPPVVRAVAFETEGEGAGEGKGGDAVRYEKDVFAAQAVRCITDLIAAKTIDPEAELEWSVVATPSEPEEHELRGKVWRAPFPLEVGDASLARDGELIAEIDEPLFERFQDAYCNAGGIERAWLLTGRVVYDPARAATKVQVRGAVAVETGLGGASESHFHFAPAALVRARNVARQQPDSIGVGWLHTHPACEACAATPACKTDLRFFSTADVEVHTTAFPSPFMIGLVLAKAHDRTVAEPGMRAYGWSGARVREVPLRVSTATGR